MLPKVFTLTCKRDYESSLVCLESFLRYARSEFQLVVLDDGSLSNEEQEQLKTRLPGSIVLSKLERDALIEQRLQDYPNCLRFRRENVLAQKLFDPALIADSPVLNFLDSDILFIRPFEGFPVFLPNTELPVFMRDIRSSYSFSPLDYLLEFQVSLSACINSGMISFLRESYSLLTLEKFLAKFIDSSRFKARACWAEQTCWAVLAKTQARAWSREQLLIAGPEVESQVTKQTIGVHFVSSYRNQLMDFISKHELASRDSVQLKSEPAGALHSVPYLFEKLKFWLIR